MEKKNDQITITGKIIEAATSENFNNLMQKEGWPVKEGYWLGRIQDKILSEAKPYFEKRNKIIDKYADQYKEDTEIKTLDGKKIFKKGDIKVRPDGGKVIAPEKIELCSKELETLSEIEIEIPVKKIKANLEDFEEWGKERGLKLSPDEQRMLFPFFDIKE